MLALGVGLVVSIGMAVCRLWVRVAGRMRVLLSRQSLSLRVRPSAPFRLEFQGCGRAGGVMESGDEISDSRLARTDGMDPCGSAAKKGAQMSTNWISSNA